jgi:predicted nucleic acid-binding protein
MRVDAGLLVAILNDRDQHHAVCVAEAKTLRGPFFTCWPEITEAAYLLRNRPAAAPKVIGAIPPEQNTAVAVS